MKSDAPAPPNYAAAAEATAAGNKQATMDQTYANRPTQVNPWGSIDYSTQQVTDPGSGQNVTKWTQNQTLNPNLQTALDAELDLQRGKSELGGGMMGRVSNELGQQMDFGKYGGMAAGVSAEGVDMNDLPQGVSSVNAGNYTSPELQKSLDYSGAADVGDGAFQRDRAENAFYDRSTARLDERFNQSDEAIDVQLRNQGLRPGDQAYDDAMKNHSFQKNDAYSSAMNDAIKFGGDEASRTFGMDMGLRNMQTGEADRQAGFFNNAAGQQAGLNMATGGQNFSEAVGAGNFSNMARQQALGEQIRIKDRDYQMANQDVNNQNALRTAAMNEELTQRGTSLNEMNALIAGNQVQTPNMAPVTMASKASGPDYLTAANYQNQGNMDQYSANQAGKQGFMSGLTGLAGTGASLFMSDRRLKKNIKKIGEVLGINIYKFEYLWGEKSIGVMADEVNPRAVVRHSSGYNMVDYAKVI